MPYSIYNSYDLLRSTINAVLSKILLKVKDLKVNENKPIPEWEAFTNNINSSNKKQNNEEKQIW